MAYWECVGEWIEVDATMYTLNTGVESPNKSVSAWNVRWKGTGVGLTSGTEYIINEHDNSVFNISNKNGQITWNGQHKFNMISPGSGANISAQWNIQWVLNAKGIPVIESFEDPELACR